MKLTWSIRKFEELSVHELYSILRLRNEVFAVEQNCVYQDMDNNDQVAWHLMCHKDQQLAAYTRLLPPGSVHEMPSIGRVVTSPLARGSGLGKELMQRSVRHCEEIFGKGSIMIGAQLYLKKFYESLGFIPTSEVYLEDGIEHIKMIYNCPS